MPTQHVRDWIDYLQALAPSIAVLVAISVGLMQAYLQRQNLKQQLFEKRFQVYVKIRPYIFAMREAGNDVTRVLDHAELSKSFLKNTAPAHFLFGSDISRLIDEIHVSVSAAHKDFSGLRLIMEEDLEFVRFERRIDECFRPYLQLYHDQHWSIRCANRINQFVDSAPERLATRNNIASE